VTLTPIVVFVTLVVKMKHQQKRAEKHEASVAMNIRNFPPDLLWACNAKASLSRKDLRRFVIEVLQQATADVKLTA